jgi:GNAT superfamily N-acetyltransferase
VFVGTIDDVIVAYALASISTPAVGVRIAMIHELYVLPDARGVGVAEMLMDALLDWARSQACDAIESAVLPGNRAGKNLFERYGLTARLIVVHRDLRPHGLDQSEAPHVHE